MGVSTKTTARHYAIGGYCQPSPKWAVNAPRLRQPRRPLCAEPTPQHERASCALRESLLAMLDGEVSSRFVPQRSEIWNALQGTPSLIERWSPRADADAHAGAVANATMPRHRHATLSVRERAVGVPFATARAISPASTLERRGCRQPVSTLERFLCALSASQPRPCGARLGTRASRSQRASSLPPAH